MLLPPPAQLLAHRRARAPPSCELPAGDSIRAAASFESLGRAAARGGGAAGSPQLQGDGGPARSPAAAPGRVQLPIDRSRSWAATPSTADRVTSQATIPATMALAWGSERTRGTPYSSPVILEGSRGSRSRSCGRQGSPRSRSGQASPGKSVASSNATAAVRGRTREWHETMRGQVSTKMEMMSKGKLHRGLSSIPSKLRTRRLDWLAGCLRTLSAEERRPASGQPGSCLEALVDSRRFEVACGVVILVNAVFIGVQQDWCTKDALQEFPEGCGAFCPGVDELFVLLYALEVVLRVGGQRMRYFFGPSWRWNLLDVVLLACSVAEVYLEGFGMAYARILRMFRLVRLLRVLRSVRFFSDLRLMTVSLLDSFTSLSWAILLLLVVQYLFSVAFMYGATTYSASGGDQAVKEQLQEWYGSLAQTMFTLLLAVTNGADWQELARPLGEISVGYQILFAFYVLFVLVGAMNVLTSTYVERVRELSRRDRDLSTQAELAAREAFLTEMRHIFLELDKDKDGKINWTDFKEYLESEQAQAYFTTQQLDTSDAAGLFSLLRGEKGDENGPVEIEEFALGCMRLRGQAKSSDVMMLIRENRQQSKRFMKELRRLECRLGFGAGSHHALSSPGGAEDEEQPECHIGIVTECMSSPSVHPLV